MKHPRRTGGLTGIDKALDHPTRRRALRRLNAGGLRGSLEVARELDLSLGTAVYHLRVLHLYGAARMIEGSRGSPVAHYESAVPDDRRVLARLAATEADDEAAASLVDKRPRGAI